MEGRLPKYFFQEMCSSGGKQTIDKVSAAFIVKNCHPQTSLSKIKVTLFLCLEGIKIPLVMLGFAITCNHNIAITKDKRKSRYYLTSL